VPDALMIKGDQKETAFASVRSGSAPGPYRD